MSCNVSFNSNKDALVTDDLPANLAANLPPKFNRSDPVDTDLDDIDSETGELTLAAYRDRLAMLGVRVKLVTPEEMDVLLARG